MTNDALWETDGFLLPRPERAATAHPADSEESITASALTEAVAALLVIGGLLLSLTGAEPRFWLALTGFALMATVPVVKGVRRLRARRSRPSGAGRLQPFSMVLVGLQPQTQPPPASAGGGSA
ncbi:hypothetical protein [Streptomyces xanthophaeus]|uniref:hypothetical protein n=1 Tax=Streptomyces xanthophaeus TaxID=67385 RepID=UPI002648CDB3|nr:hypothetical protein [Streptomyces xanthophaeus]WKD36964.1 hypothetical protein KO717_36915 [Streptomyces xanthophaeus]